MSDITVTPLAKSKLDEYLSEEPSDTVVRILVEDDGRYGLSLDEKTAQDVSFEAAGLAFVVEREFAEVVPGLRVDYLEQGASSGFSLTGGKAATVRKAVRRSEATPNPDARKFVLAFSLGKGSQTYVASGGASGADAAEAPEGIKDVLALDGVESVFQLGDFVTVNKTREADWSGLEPKITELLNAKLQPPAQGAAGGKMVPASGELKDRVEAFIANDVAPFLQADGGDIELLSVDEGVAKVRLVGACGTCPSSVMTLRMGVERRLMEAFPQELKSLELADPVAL